MEPRQALLLPTTPPKTPSHAILPQKVWTHLTLGQQEYLLQTIVLICQEFLTPPPHVREKGVTHE